ncbi:hypothetical protein CROQUDRAFT_130786 [Cronartium quercuum f. sp. fusiforme G11]|uniref:Uncharacterized protein n=1 Tax=Cronartium quercuum f. sp. fusiforme G11 TaxID=708437 RepID=A0A9P6TFY4_9BASI|nr:hypothetical protein CROQUDRAFT_130786 [Cronartium quercuum f. sp. fusiforme G11]
MTLVEVEAKVEATDYWLDTKYYNSVSSTYQPGHQVLAYGPTQDRVQTLTTIQYTLTLPDPPVVNHMSITTVDLFQVNRQGGNEIAVSGTKKSHRALARRFHAPFLPSDNNIIWPEETKSECEIAQVGGAVLACGALQIYWGRDRRFIRGYLRTNKREHGTKPSDILSHPS